MPNVRFQEQVYTFEPDETLLECLERNGHDVPTSCRSGACQTCVMQATEGTPPPSAQRGLKDALRARGFFMPCICRTSEDLTVRLPGDALPSCRVEVRDRRPLCDYVVEIELQLLDDFPARAGQFLTFIREDGLARPYSIANIPALDGFVSLHVGRVAGGEMSNWIHDELRAGDQATVRGPAGECFYLADEPDRPLILAGTGTGLAPLYAVLRDALQHDHRGPIHLFHGARRADGLYLDARLRELADQLEQFSYSASVLEGDAPGETVATPLDELLFGTYPSLKEQRLYLCGAPELVHAIKRKAFLAGASLHRIASDAFVMAS